ncbi:MAG: hypothetical protein H7Y09_01340 [Chitinophagaceae bacterium]|nr:hypothetical protein [Anaerolineae bacterium]
MSVAPPLTITNIISQFLGSAPSLEEIVAFKLPEALEQRALVLLERNRNGELTPDEHHEIEEFTRMGHFMNRVKAQARLKMAGKA